LIVANPAPAGGGYYTSPYLDKAISFSSKYRNFLVPAGRGSSSMKMKFQLGVDKEDVKDGIIILILNLI